MARDRGSQGKGNTVLHTYLRIDTNTFETYNYSSNLVKLLTSRRSTLLRNITRTYTYTHTRNYII